MIPLFQRPVNNFWLLSYNKHKLKNETIKNKKRHDLYSARQPAIPRKKEKPEKEVGVAPAVVMAYASHLINHSKKVLFFFVLFR